MGMWTDTVVHLAPVWIEMARPGPIYGALESAPLEREAPPEGSPLRGAVVVSFLDGRQERFAVDQVRAPSRRDPHHGQRVFVSATVGAVWLALGCIAHSSIICHTFTGGGGTGIELLVIVVCKKRTIHRLGDFCRPIVFSDGQRPRAA